MSRKPTRARGLGVTDEDYARMLAGQDGHCALCRSTPKTRRFSVDHDHATGAVRGLLCHRCNRNLPTWVTTDWLQRAIAYLGNTEHRVTKIEHYAETPVSNSGYVAWCACGWGSGIRDTPGDASGRVVQHGNAATTDNNGTGLTAEGTGE